MTSLSIPDNRRVKLVRFRKGYMIAEIGDYPERLVSGEIIRFKKAAPMMVLPEAAAAATTWAYELGVPYEEGVMQ